MFRQPHQRIHSFECLSTRYQSPLLTQPSTKRIQRKSRRRHKAQQQFPETGRQLSWKRRNRTHRHRSTRWRKPAGTITGSWNQLLITRDSSINLSLGWINWRSGSHFVAKLKAACSIYFSIPLIGWRNQSLWLRRPRNLVLSTSISLSRPDAIINPSSLSTSITKDTQNS